MSSRKRKTQLISEEIHGKVLNKHGNCPAKHEKSSKVVNEIEQSHYFIKNNPKLRLGEDFFKQPCISLAKAFLGKVLVRRCADGVELRGKIVETEAYLGGEDKASHSAGGKRTERNTAMFMKPGTIYVYPIYGIYLCMNVSSEGEGAAVLLRSLEPVQGQSVMRQLRTAKRKDGAKQLKDKELCNGPSKLCQALDIPRCLDRRDLASDPDIWLESDPNADPEEVSNIVSAPRIGIESHGEWAKKPLRYYILGHSCVSVRNTDAERKVESELMKNNLELECDTGQ
ncbi:hypothetical protein NQD34_006266 [Periophthalmus magnuspinnatus]|nr:hypothetical protein NQD34_006266 [Periophthalmus magnuspinnatus]